jgi:hypothetical protein
LPYCRVDIQRLRGSDSLNLWLFADVGQNATVDIEDMSVDEVGGVAAELHTDTEPDDGEDDRHHNRGTELDDVIEDVHIRFDVFFFL